MVAFLKERKSGAVRRAGLGFFVFAVLALAALTPARAVDLPTAAGSPIAGISFDDRPLMLPVQRNFQMAMLTASSELGRSCGRMEAYGWRLGGEEQQRVNQVFNNTVDRLRAQGFVVEAKALNSLSRDVTLFSADRPDKHLIFLWSAGEIGLAMVLCETSAPLSPIPQNAVKNAENAWTPTPLLPSRIPSAEAVRSAVKPSGEILPKASREHPVNLTRTGKPVVEGFSPLGEWSGTYTCSQGTTGATLHVDHVKGDQFEGVFVFYPTPKNPYVPEGKYAVFGEYDADSQRILINPGKWIERPKDYYSTIMIGSFDPALKTFSGFFQGITGCTSFEAKFKGASSSVGEIEKKAPKAVKEKKVPKKAKAKKKTAAKVEAAPVAVGKPASVPAVGGGRSSSIEPPAGIEIKPNP